MVVADCRKLEGWDRIHRFSVVENSSELDSWTWLVLNELSKCVCS